MSPVIDRYAPSPTGDLHVGNLRTAMAGWLLARAAGGRWLMRVEDLDAARVRAAGDAAGRQLDDLASLGLVWDDEAWWQSARQDAYHDAIGQLGDRLYECFCTRREIAEASSAPHADGHRPYPGTCARLSSEQRARRRRQRPGALRVRSGGAIATARDLHAGEVTGVVDDFVVVRADGQVAYNLAVVVDDIAQGVTRITRGADLLGSAPRQAWLTRQLGGEPAEYTHVGLVLNADGARLAKRDGSVTLARLRERGLAATEVVALLGDSLGLGSIRTAEEALAAMPSDGLPGDDHPFWRSATWDDEACALAVS